MIRAEIQELDQLGPLPESDAAQAAQLNRYEELLKRIVRPVTDEEARVLVRLFGPDDCYGLAWTLVHLFESAPGWPLTDCLVNTESEWIQHLRNAGGNKAR